MDPDKCLNDLRILAKRVIDGETLDEHEVEAFAARFTVLDNWIIDGGFLPSDWKGNG